MVHAQQFQLKPFGYEFEGKTYNLSPQTQVIVSRNNRAKEFHTIKIYGLEDFLIKEIEIGAKDENFLKDMRKRGYLLNQMYARFLKSKKNGVLIYDFADERINSIREQAGLLMPVKLNPKQGFALLQRVSQILIEENIASDIKTNISLWNISYEDYNWNLNELK